MSPAFFPQGELSAPRRWARLALALFVAASAVLSVSAARAEGSGDFFAALFGGFVRPRPVAPLLGLPAPEQAERPRPQVAYCVRLCDGRYFPLSGAGDPEAKCAALCPKAESRVYRGAGAIDAAEHEGRPYTALPNAFLYRTRLEPSCSCTGNGPLGLATLPIENDETLRSGDVVVTQDGARVFQPKSEARPYPPSAFVPPEDARRLSRDIRQRIEDLRLAQSAQAVGNTR